MKTFLRVFALGLLCGALQLFAQPNGSLQIHYIDVGQGDGALLISPLGQIVLFDSGASTSPHKMAAYLQQLGITQVDFLITSHFHADHCGDVGNLVSEIGMPGVAFDRGTPPAPLPGTFKTYDAVVHAKRQTATPGTSLILDQGSANPVKIDFVASNGNGVSTKDENDLSLVSVVHFGAFDAEFGGDLSGFEHNSYHDIESTLGTKVGQVEVYKVHHHGSAHSSNPDWISKIHPKIGIISCGENTYGHPTSETLDTLHSAGVTTYWTEQGRGVLPVTNKDYVGGNIIVQVPTGGKSFVVNFGGGQAHGYASWGFEGTPVNGGTTTTGTGTTFVWSKKSKVYHFPDCQYVDSIKPENLESGAAPQGKTLHAGCPK